MANDKDFVVNGPVVVGKDTKVTVGTVTSGAVDLSTGNYFVDSPSGAYTYSFTNPGAVQAFQIEATGGSAAVASAFSTTLYTGTGATQTITNNIDLAGDGGLVWTKTRAISNQSQLFDTARGGSYALESNTTSGNSGGNTVTFNSNGVTLGPYSANFNTQSLVAWTFKKQAKFFDIVTWTGDGNSGRQISHNLGSAPAVIIIKSLNFANNWLYNTNFGASSYDLLYLDLTNAASSQNYSTGAVQSAPTDSTFTLKNSSSVNGSGNTYVAYLFAHDTASDGLIQCGSFTTDSVDHATITLGWKPQWLLVKRSDNSSAADWRIIDSVRGVTSAGDAAYLEANTSDAEAQTGDGIYTFTDTGFTQDNLGASRQYIYMAIRSAAAPAITWPTNIEWTQGTTPKTPAEGATDVYTFTTDDGGTTYTGIQSIDTAS